MPAWSWCMANKSKIENEIDKEILKSYKFRKINKDAEISEMDRLFAAETIFF